MRQVKLFNLTNVSRPKCFLNFQLVSRPCIGSSFLQHSLPFESRSRFLFEFWKGNFRFRLDTLFEQMKQLGKFCPCYGIQLLGYFTAHQRGNVGVNGRIVHPSDYRRNWVCQRWMQLKEKCQVFREGRTFHPTQFFNFTIQNHFLVWFFPVFFILSY